MRKEKLYKVTIQDDWSGEFLTKEEAKKYINEWDEA